MFDRIKQTLQLLPADEAQAIVDQVFDEMIDTSEMTEFERAHLRRRRREFEKAIEAKKKHAA